MSTLASEHLAETLALADALRQGRDRMLEPQDLASRYGRVISALDHILHAIGFEAVLGGGGRCGATATSGA